MAGGRFLRRNWWVGAMGAAVVAVMRRRPGRRDDAASQDRDGDRLRERRLQEDRPAILVRRDLTPAIKDLLLSAATQIHGRRNLSARRCIPAVEGTDPLLAQEAERFYRSGPPLLQNSFPFWLASLIGRLWCSSSQSSPCPIKSCGGCRQPMAD